MPNLTKIVLIQNLWAFNEIILLFYITHFSRDASTKHAQVSMWMISCPKCLLDNAATVEGQWGGGRVGGAAGRGGGGIPFHLED